MRACAPGSPTSTACPTRSSIRAPAAFPLAVREGDEGSVQTWLDAEAAMPFDLAQGPLWRCSLLRVGTDDHVLVLTMHHIITDGWSARRICGRSRPTRYAAAHSGAVVTLPGPCRATGRPCGVATSLAAQRGTGQPDRVLARRPARPRAAGLPGRPTAPVAAHRGRGDRRVGASAPLCQALRELARAEGVSLLAVLMTGFSWCWRAIPGNSIWPSARCSRGVPAPRWNRWWASSPTPS